MGSLGDLPEGFEDFPRIWRDSVAPVVQELEAERSRAFRVLSLCLGGGVASWFVLTEFVGATGLGFLIGAALVLSSLIFGFAPLGDVAARAKQAILHPSLQALGMRHTQSGFEPPAIARLQEFRLLPDTRENEFEDLIEGDDFALCEATLKEVRRDGNSEERTVVFRGVIGWVKHPARILGHTVLARDLGWFNRMVAPQGMARAGLGVSEFEQKFALWTNDQVEARYLVTPLVMERLLALEKEFHGRYLRAAFADGYLYFAMVSADLFEVGRGFRPFTDPARMRDLIAELSSVRRLVHALRDLPAGR